MSWIDDEGEEEFLQLGAAPVVVGRAAEADISTSNPTVSRNHCRIEALPDASGWRVVDLGSSHGTDVRGRRVRSSELSDGDVIMCGASFGVTFYEVP